MLSDIKSVALKFTEMFLLLPTWFVLTISSATLIFQYDFQCHILAVSKPVVKMRYSTNNITQDV